MKSNILKLSLLTALALLSSCELVKNGDSVNLSVRISEIGACYYQDPVLTEKLPFIEIYNYGDEAVELSDMQLRCSASKLGATTLWKGSFNLPSYSIPAGGYVVIRSGAGPAKYDKDKYPDISDIERKDDPAAGIFYILKDGYFPFWTNHGFAELVAKGQSVNFVRWGSSGIASPLEGTYDGCAPGTYYDSAYDGASSSQLRSIGRIDEDKNTNSGRDWKSYYGNSTMVTPGGKNHG